MNTEKLYAARLRACGLRPYLATALFALDVVPSAAVPTMAVDRYWRCYVSPAFVDRMTREELAGVWVHEVSHLLRDHHGRGDRLVRAGNGAGERSWRFRLNLAADCEINDDIFDEDLALPDGAVTPDRLHLKAGLLLEEYINDISLGPLTDPYAWHDCGSGADGQDRAWDLGERGARGLTESEREAVRFRVARGIVGAPGDATEGWRRWANDVVHPPQPWRDLLGAAIRSAVTSNGVGDSYTYARPARRSTSLPGVILPSLRRRPPRVSVVIDTSGSVSDDELGSALLEVAAILKALGGRRDLVTVLSCDAAVHTVGRICDAEGIPLVGGGGTDLRTGIEAALGRSQKPDTLVVLTDGQTAWPSSGPSCRTVVGLFPRPSRWQEKRAYQPPAPPGWARVVRIG
ncbi:VWA-like domain-containing protein [Promicromonospora kroppenstedtii]|uniref:VWA-like domain-containing protein n=1 Tax=Promicromonospora kroppenstedtii TaxID=440482 RepID=A0ABW7XIB5_9MICO